MFDRIHKHNGLVQFFERRIQFFVKRPKLTLWIASLSIIASILTLFATDLRSLYTTRILDANRSSQGFADVLAEPTARTFESVDRTLQLAAAIRNDVKDGRITEQGANDSLRTLWQGSPAILAI